MGNNPGAMFLLGGAASAWLLYDMVTATEGPSQTLALMKYLLIAVLVIVTVYSGAKWFFSPPTRKPHAPAASGEVHKRKTGRRRAPE
jgi:hypothetical protein